MSNTYGRMLRVNLTTGAIEKSQLSDAVLRKYVGASGIGARLLWDEMASGADPLGEDAKVVIATGPIGGTLCPSGGSYEVCFKAPLTGAWCQSRSGGRFGSVLRYAGYDFLLIEGSSESPVYLDIDNDKVELKPADALWGLDVEATTERLVGKRTGTDVSVAAIGPAGENGVLYAALMNDIGRAAGRGGIGAVFGGKHLKAIVARGDQQIDVDDPEALMDVVAKIEEDMKSFMFESIPLLGTAGMVTFMNGISALPTRNFSTGRFDGAASISGELLDREYNIKRRACYGCLLACGRYSEVKTGRWATPPGEGPEYETLDMFGANCCVSDLEAVLHAGQLCNVYGLDTISTGSTIAFAMECFEAGLLTLDDTEGVPLAWGSAEAVDFLVERIAKNEGVGELLAQGVKRAAEKLGPRAEEFAIHVKGMEIPAHEPRAESKLLALGYAVSPRGACHMHPNWHSIWDFGADDGMQDFGLPMPPEAPMVESYRKGEGYKFVALQGEITEILGGCIFYSWGGEGNSITPRRYAEVVKALLGWEMTAEELIEAAERSWNLKRCFNVREGFGREQDTLPARLFKPLLQGPSEDSKVEKLDEMTDGYYEALGWDKETGRPSADRLAQLGLEDVAQQLAEA
jgi:aldehyde:ferredoxin oxidoreductase